MNDLKKQFYEMCYESGNYDEPQLVEIYKGLEILPLEQVMIYATTSYNWGQMREIRTGLETLPLKQVLSYAKPKICREAMGERRMQMQDKYFKKIVSDDTRYYYHFQIEEILRAVKSLPFDQAISIADSNLSTLEMEDRRKYLEQKFLQDSIKIKCLLDGYSLDELLELSEYVNQRIDILSQEKHVASDAKQKSLSMVINN